MIKGIAHIAVTVRDMEASLRFYRDTLGFRPAFELEHYITGEPWIVYLNIAPGQFIELFYGGEEQRDWHDRLAGFNHLCLETEDVRAAVERLREAGYPIDAEPRQGSDRNLQAWTRDPDGIRIELMQIVPGSPQSRFS